jgi:pimeloyl-ACP methyl ester carboxylesterase
MPGPVERCPTRAETPMATFCLIHGAWHDSSCWREVAGALRVRGHAVVSPDLPLHDPDAGYARRLAPAVDLVARVDGPVVIVGHSLGSDYAAVLATEVREPSVIHLCPRLGGIPPPPGAPRRTRVGFPWPAQDARGVATWDPEPAATAMYGRLDSALARALAARLRPMAPVPEPFPLRRHPDVPTAVVYAAEDELFEPAWIRFMARESLGVKPIELPGGHFPMLEAPGRLTAVLDDLAPTAGQPGRD